MIEALTMPSIGLYSICCAMLSLEEKTWLSTVLT
jgi:hypothetical protein